MKLDLSCCFPGYGMHKLSEAHLPAMFALCAGNPLYYEKYGTPLTLDSLRADLNACPPDAKLNQKHFIGLWDGTQLVAMLDLIENWPEDGTAYIGWFILDAARSGQGLGSRLIALLKTALAKQGAQKIRLAYVKDNPQSKRFWEKNQFQPTGEERDMGNYQAVLMEYRFL